jgi:uncharacterized low-complexity protein
MKKIVLTAIVATALVISAWKVGKAQTQFAQFTITVSQTGDGYKAECTKGCYWLALTWKCDPAAKKPCTAEIDERGVGVSK